MSTDVRLSIKEIRNANPTWVRSQESIGSLYQLEESLRAHGMVQPVLLRNDFVLLDGARRVEAADNLGWKNVPVIVTHDWPTTTSYFERLHKVDPAQYPSKPMRWVEMNYLWSDLLKPLYREQRQVLAKAERQRRAKLRAQGASEVTIFQNRSTYTTYTNDCAEMYQIRPIHVKLIRDIFHTYELVKEQGHPEITEPFERIVAKAEKIGIKTTSTVRQFVRNLNQGVPLDLAVKRVEGGLDNAHEAPWRLGKKRMDPPTLKAVMTEVRRGTEPGVGLGVLRNLTRLLEQVSQEAHRFHKFDDEVNPAAVNSIAYDIKRAISQIQSMRRRMEAHGQSLGESEE